MANKAKAKRSNSTNIPAVKFVTVVKEIHAAGGGHQEIADELGLKVGSVATRISQLRTKHGVNMPVFTRGGGGGAKLDVAELNAILAE